MVHNINVLAKLWLLYSSWLLSLNPKGIWCFLKSDDNYTRYIKGRAKKGPEGAFTPRPKSFNLYLHIYIKKIKNKKGPNTKRKVTVLTWQSNIIPRFLPYFNFTLLNHQFYPTCSLSQFTHHIFIFTFSWHFNFKA